MEARFHVAVIGRFIGIAALGQYRIAWRLATQAASPLVGASAYVLLPAFARISDDEERFSSAALRAIGAVGLVVFPLALIVIPLGEPTIVLVLGEQWRPAGEILVALSGVLIAEPLVSVSSEILKAAGHPKVIAKMHGIGALGSMSVIIALFPLGTRGIASGISVVFVVVASYALRHVAGVLAISVRRIFRELQGPLIAAIGVTVSLVLLRHALPTVDEGTTTERLGWLGLELAFSATVYLALLMAIGARGLAEMKAALRSLRQR
jgi:PST family polysaccharide transporter